jgi:DNA-binding CsgD family transcriptional regulator
MEGAARSASQVLERIARSGEAVFARDAGERIIFWSKKCEELLGLPARSVLGKHCHEVTCGRDLFGNIYCRHNCPIAFQARNRSDPVRRFSLRLETKNGPRWFDVGTFAIPSYHPALSTLVHTLRERNGSPPSGSLQKDDAPDDPLRPIAAAGDESAVLTRREKEVLALLARGMSTSAISAELFISPVTVRNHIGAVLNKLNVHSRLGAVALAFRNRIV